MLPRPPHTEPLRSIRPRPTDRGARDPGGPRETLTTVFVPYPFHSISGV